MKRLLISCAVALPLFALTASTLTADVRTRERTAIKIEGMLGRMIGMFGGKSMRDGIVSSVAVKGDRKSVTNDQSGQIIDLSEEKIYNIDFKKKSYEVTTFDEIRQQMREARERAEKDAKEAGERPQQEEPGQKEKGTEIEVDFEVKETGQKKSLAGYDTRQVLMIVTVREKGRTLEEGGGLVMTADTWFGPEIAAMKEVTDFDMRYWKQLAGPELGAMSPQTMAAVLAMYPMISKAAERMKEEGTKLQGTVLATTTTFEAVKSKEAMAQENQGGGGGLGGMLARRMKKDSGKQRATFMTIQHETQEVATSVDAASLQLPAGFKEEK